MKLKLQNDPARPELLPGRWWFLLASAALLGAQAVRAEPVRNNAGQASVLLPANSPSASVANNVTSQPRSFVFERRLQDETLCRVTVRGQSTTTNLLETVDNMEISLDGQTIAVPPEACSGLKELDPSSGVQVVETGTIKYVLLVGGKEPLRWRAKLAIQNGAVTTREYALENQLPVIKKYSTLRPGPMGPVKVVPDTEQTNPASLHQQEPSNAHSK
jgi:hypothetical protein